MQPVEPLAIICHGDFLRNNIAFKYETPDDVSRGKTINCPPGKHSLRASDDDSFNKIHLIYSRPPHCHPQLEHPIDVTMFDFQTMCYTSPMMDLATFMANSTGKDVRGPNFEIIFRAYHTELINILCDKLGSSEADLPDQYSWVVLSTLLSFWRGLPQFRPLNERVAGARIYYSLVFFSCRPLRFNEVL